jgi:DNA primase
MLARLDLEAVRARNPIPTIAGAFVKLRPASREWTGCCPFHSDRSPSFTVFNGGRRFHCFGCGAAGDVIDFVARAHGVGFREAVAMLGDGGLPFVSIPDVPAAPARDNRQDEALAIWRDAVEAAGTPAESYLRSRGLICPLPPSIRFAGLPYGKSGPVHPALVALVTGSENRPTGIQRTFLNPAGTGKAAVPKPKLSLGRVAGGAIRLAPATDCVVVCEGLEDGLSLQQSLSFPTWATAGTGGLLALDLPQSVRDVVIAADSDEAGEKAAMAAAERFAGQGRKVRVIRPLAGFKDFNDELRGIER